MSSTWRILAKKVTDICINITNFMKLPSKKPVIIWISLFLLISLQAPPILARGGPPGHVGDYCITCHQRFSYEKPYAEDLPVPVTFPKVISFSPCDGTRCHNSKTDGFSTGKRDRWPLHLKICGNCHKMINGSYSIHRIHLNFEDLLENIPEDWNFSKEEREKVGRPPVDCSICHWTPEGYVTPLVMVPPYEEEFIAGSTVKNRTIRRPPWNGDCGFCHPSMSGMKRVHDVHMPVILKACPVCHSPTIKSRNDLALKIAGRPFPSEEEEIKSTGYEKTIDKMKINTINREIFDFFNKIAEYMLAIFNALRR